MFLHLPFTLELHVYTEVYFCLSFEIEENHTLWLNLGRVRVVLSRPPQFTPTLNQGPHTSLARRPYVKGTNQSNRGIP